MNNRPLLVAIVVLAGCATPAAPAPVPEPFTPARFAESFAVDPADWSSTGRNPYFILEPGYELVLEGKEHGEPVRLVITVLDETKVVDGVETRVVVEHESEDGEPAEISRNYFAISRRDNSVYYFGEEVDEYEDGKVASHGGAWLSGVNGARFGLMMPGTPVVGSRYYQEIAPGVAMDRAEVLSVTETFETPAGTFTNCLKTSESSAVEKGSETKVYAPGVGLLRDGALRLVRHGPRAK